MLAIGAGSVLACAGAAAQPATPPRRIALLMPSSPAFSKPQLDAFMSRMNEMGYVEGRNVVVEKRWADGKVDQLPVLARELLALNPDVVVAPSSPVAAAFKKATSKVPVVFTAVSSPVEQGFVASLSHPGGNMTGRSFRSEALATKLGEMLREIFPAARTIAVLEIDDPNAKVFRSALQANMAKLGFATEYALVRNPAEFPSAFAQVARSRAEILFVGAAPMMVSNTRELVERAEKARLPVVALRRAFTAGGGLLSYDSDLRDDYRRAAEYVDRILRGAKPADLAVDQPERFHLSLNLRTARVLGIRIPQSVLVRADEVIE